VEKTDAISWPDLLQNAREAVAGAGDLGSDLGGGPLFVAGESNRLRVRVRIQILEVKQGLEGIQKEKVEIRKHQK
jgi:hypothetical protein